MVKRLIPVNLFDITNLELWLSQMAEEGLMLNEIKGRKAIFRDEYCRKINYRVIPTANKKELPKAEMKELFAEAGWHFVCGVQEGLFVFSSDAEFPKELPFTKEEERPIYEELKKKKRNSVILSVLAVFFLGAVQVFTIYFNIEDYILGEGQYVGLTYAMAFLINMISLTREYRSYRLLKEKLESIDAGYKMEVLEIPTTKWFRFESVIHILSIFFALLPLLAIIVGKDGGQKIAEEELPISYVALQELEMTKLGREYKEYPIFVEKASTFFSPVQYTIEQVGRLEYQQNDRVIADEVYLSVEYYELRFAFLGERAVGEFMEYYDTYPVNYKGVDQAWVGGLAGAQRIFLLKGNQIIAVRYDGDLAIEDYTGEFVNMLK